VACRSTGCGSAGSREVLHQPADAGRDPNYNTQKHATSGRCVSLLDARTARWRASRHPLQVNRHQAAVATQLSSSRAIRCTEASGTRTRCARSLGATQLDNSRWAVPEPRVLAQSRLRIDQTCLLHAAASRSYHTCTRQREQLLRCRGVGDSLHQVDSAALCRESRAPRVPTQQSSQQIYRYSKHSSSNCQYAMTSRHSLRFRPATVGTWSSWSSVLRPASTNRDRFQR
jgi:hypothetical protein